MNTHHFIGFVKAAMDHGLSLDATIRLYKEANSLANLTLSPQKPVSSLKPPGMGSSWLNSTPMPQAAGASVNPVTSAPASSAINDILNKPSPTVNKV